MTDIKPISGPSNTPSSASEVRGILKLEGDVIAGAYGDYWHVQVKPNDGTLGIEATLSAKVWNRTGLPAPDEKTSVEALARQNENGRWNVVEIDAGPSELSAVEAHYLHIDERQFYHFEIRRSASVPIEVSISREIMEAFGIASLAAPCVLLSDWIRSPKGWRLASIRDETLRGFFCLEDGNETIAYGFAATAWSSTDDVDKVPLHLAAEVKGLSVCCHIRARTLRSVGLRSLEKTRPLTASLVLRKGRWWLSELLDPRPDLQVAKNGILFNVATRIAFEESDGDEKEKLVWIEIENPDLVVGLASLRRSMLEERGEGDVKPGARIICDLKSGKRGWYASRIHSVAD